MTEIASSLRAFGLARASRIRARSEAAGLRVDAREGCERAATATSLERAQRAAYASLVHVSLGNRSQDETLRKTADRIQARAIRRCGELLNEIKSSAGRPKKGGDAPTITKAKAAKDAGLSRDQRHQAERVARVPKLDFERTVESDAPPTVTKLAGHDGHDNRRPVLQRRVYQANMVATSMVLPPERHTCPA